MAKRKTMGKRLLEARQALGMTRKDVQDRIRDEFGATIGETTIRAAELDQFPNPGIKTIELHARAVDLSPLEVIAQHLDEPPAEKTHRFSKSRFGIMSEIYEALPPDRKLLFDEMLDMVMERMRRA
jgi:transcriptional regulator with XRE-family HTH domain